MKKFFILFVLLVFVVSINGCVFLGDRQHPKKPRHKIERMK